MDRIGQDRIGKGWHRRARHAQLTAFTAAVRAGAPLINKLHTAFVLCVASNVLCACFSLPDSRPLPLSPITYHRSSVFAQKPEPKPYLAYRIYICRTKRRQDQRRGSENYCLYPYQRAPRPPLAQSISPGKGGPAAPAAAAEAYSRPLRKKKTSASSKGARSPRYTHALAWDRNPRRQPRTSRSSRVRRNTARMASEAGPVTERSMSLTKRRGGKIRQTDRRTDGQGTANDRDLYMRTYVCRAGWERRSHQLSRKCGKGSRRFLSGLVDATVWRCACVTRKVLSIS